MRDLGFVERGHQACKRVAMRACKSVDIFLYHIVSLDHKRITRHNIVVGSILAHLSIKKPYKVNT